MSADPLMVIVPLNALGPMLRGQRILFVFESLQFPTFTFLRSHALYKSYLEQVHFRQNVVHPLPGLMRLGPRGRRQSAFERRADALNPFHHQELDRPFELQWICKPWESVTAARIHHKDSADLKSGFELCGENIKIVERISHAQVPKWIHRMC